MRDTYNEIAEGIEMQGFGIEPCPRPEPLRTLSAVAIASSDMPPLHAGMNLDAGDLSPDEFAECDEEIEEAEEI